MIQFYLNGQPHSVDDAEPSLTILRYLRTSKGHLATKEGCASGDCGACTVMVGDYQQGSWHYRSVNSCITLLASIHGKHLITVEGLADTTQAERLHPVQQAMVECHGSQCGFCTPGFVMSLVTADENNQHQPLTEEQVLDAVSGNLCRCTGYRPIVDAALSCTTHAKNQALFYQAEAPAPVASADITTASGRTVFPTSEAELLAAMADMPNARLVAGGTDLLLEQTQAFKTLRHLIGISQVPELKAIQVEDGRVAIGAAVTFSQMEASLADTCPELIQLLHRVGSRQIRNQGTLVGNIANASPIGDSPPFLLTMDAELELAGASGRRLLPLDQFFLDYKKTALQAGEYIRQVIFNLPGDEVFVRAYKVSKRYEDDISAVLLVVRWQVVDGKFSDVRIAYGGMAAIPKRALAAEKGLTGAPASEATIQAAMAAVDTEFTPMTDVRASANYRATVAKNLLLKAWLEFSAGGQSASVWQSPLVREVSQSFGG
ncbi:xanthine dehydrogenase small subunit [Halioxenophilus sp. WMMB6]|uniref:xanthine dehydrogenase small subunit n=1 Tax=Halioxenophilus sp. WMMB6 TaxID=3073815 RepID=UPI00295E422F|nr:xanthine dehydrogenase small subunit [Halioxenophilus sp. WMMB6]